MWLLLIKNTATGEMKMWEVQHRYDVVRRFMAWNEKYMPRNVWSEEMDEFLLKNYRRLSAVQIAMHLSSKEGRRITKNSVIGRHRDLMTRQRQTENGRV